MNDSTEKSIEEKSSLKVSELCDEIAELKDQLEFLKSTLRYYQSLELEKDNK